PRSRIAAGNPRPRAGAPAGDRTRALMPHDPGPAHHTTPGDKMTMNRKQFGRFALATGLALGLAGTALARADFPSKPITMVVPASAGGTTDLAARMTAQTLGPVLGQSIVVENKGGGNGNIA